MDGRHAHRVVAGGPDFPIIAPPSCQSNHGEPRRVFLSHTAELRALPEPRSFIAAIEAAIARAGDVVVDMAYFTAHEAPPAQLDCNMVASADVYVLLAGFCYGTPVRDQPRLSYTEQEFEIAGELGIPRLVFLLSEQASGQAGLFLDQRHAARQARFRQRLRNSGITTTDVLSPDHAETVVFDALMKLPRAASSQAQVGRVWSIPARLVRFTGREDILVRLRATLTGQRPAVVQAVHGMGGVGKTTLALEYAHCHADDYDIAWWIPAEQPDIIPNRLADLARALNLAHPTDTTETAVVRLLGQLRRQDRWLLVFDNADNPHAVAPFLPGGRGHVIITSRNPHWDSLAASVEIGEFTRAESVALIRCRLPRITAVEAESLAEAVGDLPLVVDQAAALLVDVGWTVPDYLALLQSSAERLLDQRDQAGGYLLSVAASWQVTFEHLLDTDPAATQLVTLAAWLAPEPIPLTVFVGHAALLPEPLATSAADPLTWARVLSVLRRRAVARVSADCLLLHRIPAALLRAQDIAVAPEHGWAALAVRLLAVTIPADPWNQPETWPTWHALLAHVRTVTGPARALDTVANDADWLLDRMATYLRTRDKPHTALPRFERTYDQPRSPHRESPPNSRFCTDDFILASAELGEYEPAPELNQDTLHRCPTLGDCHPSTRSGGNFSPALWAWGAYEQARDFDQDTLNRRRNTLGDNHPSTLRSANNLAADLRALGEYEQARDLDQDTLDRRRNTLGDNHPSTLCSASNLAADLRALGEYEQARDLDQDTLDRRRNTLGDNHPSTLRSATNLTIDLRALGRQGEIQWPSPG